MSMPMMKHGQTNLVVPHFSCLGLNDALVSLMTLSESHDANTGANGVALPKSHVVSHFDYLDLRNAMMPLMMSLAHHMMLVPMV